MSYINSLLDNDTPVTTTLGDLDRTNYLFLKYMLESSLMCNFIDELKEATGYSEYMPSILNIFRYYSRK